MDLHAVFISLQLAYYTDNITIKNLACQARNRKGDKMLKLKEIRKSKGLTQKEVGEIMNVTESTANRMENGINVINHRQIIQLCEALDIRAGQLLGLEEIE